MRISALHLMAYGHFKGRSLAFGAKPGFQLIYGDNETGKSTALRALSSVLFGYPHEVVDGYMHDPKDIALGADLIAAGGQTLSFLRKRRGRQALATMDGTALEEAAVSQMLAGTSKEVFERVFALDHHRLHEHATALLSEGGSLGFTLAAAGSGLASLKSTLDKLKAERDALFLPAGVRPRINRQIASLNDLRKEARRRSVSLADYKKRQKEIDELEAELVEVRNKNRGIERELRKLDRIARNLPLRVQYLSVLGKLEEMLLIPLLPDDASEKRIKAEAEREAADIDLASANEALAELDRNMTDIELDQAVLEKTTEISALSAQRAVVENADKSLPRRDAERAQLYKTVQDLLGKAELAGSATELATLLPSEVKRKQLATLANNGRKLTVQQETLTEAAAIAEEDVGLAMERLASTEAPSDMTILNAALLAADKLGDIRSDIVKRSRILETKMKLTRDGIVGLGLLPGDVSALRKLSVPSNETVVQFRQAFATSDADHTTHAAELARLGNEVAAIESRIEKLSRDGAIATKEELVLSREARDEAWAVIRSVYIDRHGKSVTRSMPEEEGDLAGKYEHRVRQVDGTADAIIEHTKEAAELSLLARQKAEIERKITAGTIQSEVIARHRRELDEEWLALWPANAFSIRSPAEMVEWLKRRDALLDDDIEQQGQVEIIAELETKEARAIADLLGALKQFVEIDGDTPLHVLQARARAYVGAATNASTQHAKAMQALEDGRSRKRQADAAEQRIKGQIVEWSKNWKAALRAAGLGDSLTIDSAIAILDIMTTLDGLKAEIDSISHRIEAMTEDKTQFEAATSALGVLAADIGEIGATEIVRRLEVRLQAAKESEATLRNLRDQHKIRTAAQRQATDRISRSNAALEALSLAAGCAAPNLLIEVERASATKQEALLARERLESRILEDGAGHSLDALFSECEGIEIDDVADRIEALQVELAELEVKIEKMMMNRASLVADFEALFGRDQAAEARQDAANVEAEIGSLAQSYVDLTLQGVMLRRAIDLYRDRNQGPILSRAKGLFAQLTDDTYSGLRADVSEDDEPILIAEHATRGSLEVAALSDGTVDALYLALRLAVVHEHNAANEPLPFVADDLLLNLDNKRAQSTLRTLGQLAETGQVLFFTHHEHIAELARVCVPADILSEHRL